MTTYTTPADTLRGVSLGIVITAATFIALFVIALGG